MSSFGAVFWSASAQFSRATRRQFLLVAFAGITAILLLTAAHRTPPSTWSHIGSHVYSGWTAGFTAVTENDGSIELSSNHHWSTNWNQSVLNAATTSQHVDRWRYDPDDGIHPKQKKSKDETIHGLRQLVRDLPVISPQTYPPYVTVQNLTIRLLTRLADRLEQDECSENELRVVIAGDMHFGDVMNGGNSGENIWARSTMDALDELGHTILYTYHLREISLIYLAIPNLVSHVIISAADAHVCAQAGIPKQLSEQEMENENAVTVVQGQELAILMKECGKTDMEIEKAINGKEIWGWQNPWSSSDQFKRSTCVQRKGAEDGIPVWKIFSFHFWSGTSHPLGAPWTLSPEDYSSHPVHKFTTEHNFYLGYSVEKYCSVHRQPLEERLDRALVFAKDTKYFEEGNNMFWNQDRTFQDLKERTGIQFLALANSADTVLPDPGLTNEGRQSIDVFYDHLGKSRVLIGIGRPPLSPTPYDALCLGVPFLNPIIYWDHDNPSHMSAWACQHDGLLATGKPYVHHVHAGDLRGLEEAIQHARENPFDAYILPSMTPHANRVRHQMLMNLNFRSLGKDYILRRRAQGHYIPFMI